MVDKTSSVGASTSSAVQNSATVKSANQEVKINSVYAEANSKGGQKLKPVPKPKPTRITITVRDGESLGYIAGRYNTSVSQIVKLNNLDDPDRLKPGQKLQIDAIDSKELKEYENYQYALEKQKWEQEEKESLELKIKTSNEQVEKAQEYGYGEDYSFTVDKDGNILVKLKKEKLLGEVRRDFLLPKGSLSSTNNIKGKYKPETIIDSEKCMRYNDYDLAEVPVGDSLLIDGQHFHPDENRTAWDRFWGNFF